MDAFQGTENVIITPIYAAREKDTGLISSSDLAEKIVGAYSAKDFDDAKAEALSRLGKGDILITIGAGDIYKVGEEILNSEG